MLGGRDTLVQYVGAVKDPFHGATKQNKIRQRIAQIRRHVMKTSSHRQMAIGAILVDYKTSYFIFCWQEKFLFL